MDYYAFCNKENYDSCMPKDLRQHSCQQRHEALAKILSSEQRRVESGDILGKDRERIVISSERIYLFGLFRRDKSDLRSPLMILASTTVLIRIFSRSLFEIKPRSLANISWFIDSIKEL